MKSGGQRYEYGNEYSGWNGNGRYGSSTYRNDLHSALVRVTKGGREYVEVDWNGNSGCIMSRSFTDTVGRSSK